ncbi:unnamed protein product [Pneumocystis jirovecii]|uniref:HIG1 domain-containing protein n=1 Tax=Pneumocystis jirovecii TaxID=42068 RepID=L0P7G8_PNEJI|nr:unnamed protein product [Pneumocystis jirovecii]
MEKNSRKSQKRTFSACSVLATCLAFLGATIAIQRKNKLLANRMFRYRVYAQGFTLAIMVAGNIYYRSMMQQNTQS